MGKGFAVVASEVKSLSNQTAQATELITSQIKSIQISTHEAARAIDHFGKSILELNEVGQSVADAVEQQVVATQEIAQRAEMASVGTSEVSGNVYVLKPNILVRNLN